MPQKIETGVEPYEVVLGEPKLTLHSPSPLDPETARGAITLANGFRGSVELSRDGRTAKFLPDEPIPPGAHTLTVSELVSKRGKHLSDRLEIPFVVTDSNAKVRSNLRVENIVRLRVNGTEIERLPLDEPVSGKYVEVMKAVDRRTGKPTELAFDERGKPVDHEKLFAKLENSRRRKYGKVHPTLHAQLERSNRRVPVAIWVTVDDEPLPEKRERGETKRRPSAEREHAKHIAEMREVVADLADDHGATEIRTDDAAPVVYARMTPNSIANLQRRKEVAALFLHETEGILDLKDSMAIAQSDKVQTNLSFTGKDVNVAVYEDGPDDTTNLSITAQYEPNPSTTQHARHTHGIIKNIEPNKPHGHAKDCNLHSANSMDLDAIKWAAQTRGCTVISQSFHRDSEQTDSGQSFDDKYKDWLVLHWPWPTILQAAGNGGSSEYVNHKGYNSLTVANHDDTAATLASDSCFRNPSSGHSDRELPEVAANGMGVTCVGLTMSGTSMAAPAAAGVTALMQQAAPTLKSWPEGCRAILLAGASKDITGNTWWADRNAGIDASDGSGAVDALEGVRIAQSRKSRNAAASRRGWDIGTLRSSDIGANGETTFSYQVVVPQFFFGARVKVALAWDSLAAVVDTPLFQFAFDQLKVDLDLHVYDSRGNQVGYSGSWDNSYEIAGFPANRGETYTIKIRRWSGTDDVWYGIAWTVQGTPFIRPDWGLTEAIVRAAGG
jgi:Subtilase family